MKYNVDIAKGVTIGLDMARSAIEESRSINPHNKDYIDTLLNDIAQVEAIAMDVLETISDDLRNN